MMRVLAMLLLAGALALGATGANAERLVSTLSTNLVQITSSFDGETLTMFGNIEPEAGAEQKFVEGPFHVVVVVVGPTTDRVARKKTNRFGIWVNTDQVVFEDFPAYFRVLSSGHLRDITSEAMLAVENILPEAQARHSAQAGWWSSVVFGAELVRLMTEKGFYGVNESGVRFLSETTYSARLVLPGDIPNGPFVAQTFVFKNGQVVARKSEGFAVSKIGFERFLGIAALQYPLLYGLVCVALALFTGWLGGVVFKR
jgi:uncharacterized protein (TIGR02186 family)